jgi:hypothetical protein
MIGLDHVRERGPRKLAQILHSRSPWRQTQFERNAAFASIVD